MEVTTSLSDSLHGDSGVADKHLGEYVRGRKSGHHRFYELLDDMATTHDKKNRDYAHVMDPFSNFRACERAGISMVDGIYARMSDKWERITNLLAKRRKGEGPAVKEEFLKDALLDLANYAIIESIALEEAELRDVSPPMKFTPISDEEIRQKCTDSVR